MCTHRQGTNSFRTVHLVPVLVFVKASSFTIRMSSVKAALRYAMSRKPTFSTADHDHYKVANSAQVASMDGFVHLTHLAAPSRCLKPANNKGEPAESLSRPCGHGVRLVTGIILASSQANRCFGGAAVSGFDGIEGGFSFFGADRLGFYICFSEARVASFFRCTHCCPQESKR